MGRGSQPWCPCVASRCINTARVRSEHHRTWPLATIACRDVWTATVRGSPHTRRAVDHDIWASPTQEDLLAPYPLLLTAYGLGANAVPRVTAHERQALSWGASSQRPAALASRPPSAPGRQRTRCLPRRSPWASSCCHKSWRTQPP